MEGVHVHTHTHTHTHTLSLSSYKVISDNHAVCYLQRKCLSYCPCMLSWSKFSWVQRLCEEKHRCCVLKSWTALNTGEVAWPVGLHFKAMNSLLWIRSHKIVDSKSPPWPHNSWGSLKLCCYGSGAMFLPALLLWHVKSSRAIVPFNQTAAVMTYQRQNETNKDENTFHIVFEMKMYHRKLKKENVN